MPATVRARWAVWSLKICLRAGDVFPINPKHGEVQGHKAYPDLKSIGKPVELAVITTPAVTVPGIIEACGEYGIRTAVVISAGFS